MKQGLFFILLLASSAVLAQLNPCAFGGQGKDRSVGFKIDRLPDDFNLGQAGDNNRWIFSSLKSATYVKYKFQSAKEGRYREFFPEADYVLQQPAGGEDYYYKDRDRWFKVGQVVLAKGAIEPVVLSFKIPLQGCIPGFRSASRLYGTNYEVSLLKDNVLQQFVVRENYSDEQDARGRLYLPQGIFDAYRVRREVTYQSSLTSDLAPMSIDNYTSFIFLDEVTEEILLEIRLDAAGQIKEATYLAEESAMPSKPSVGPNQFTLYPSTSFGDVRLDFVNFNQGKYNFEIFNIIGKKLWSTEYDLSGDMTIKEDLTFLPKGTYVYTIRDSNGNNLVTKRLAIINP